MNSRVQNQYAPDYVSPPGETLLELLEDRGMSQAELARRTGRPKKTINEIIQGKTTITPKTALQLERVLGTPADFWNNRERQYRQHLARLEENTELAAQVEWLQNFPIKEIVKRGWIEGGDNVLQQLREVLNFFGVASPDQWEAIWCLDQSSVVFRKTTAYQSERGAIAAWLRQGELQAQEIDCRPFDDETFQQSLVEEIRPLTVEPPEVFQPELERLCAQAGVAVVFLPQLPRARVSGATRWLTPKKALIQLSLRYKTDDHLWFTFFHEAGHILLHGKRDLFLEDGTLDEEQEKEEEANRFAADTLIPPDDLARFLAQPQAVRRSKQGIRDFAHSLGIAPGIVVGRLQHDGDLPHSHCNDLKQTFAWAEE